MFPSIDELEARVAFGRFIRRRRERLGWSQRHLERVTWIDQTVISRIENGRLRAVRLHQIARLLCILAPEILEIQVRQSGGIREAQTWEPVRPFEPPILAPPIDLDRSRPSRPSRTPRGRRPSDDEWDDEGEDIHAWDVVPEEELLSAATTVDAAEGIAEQDGAAKG